MRPFLLTPLFVAACTSPLVAWTTHAYGPHGMVATGESDQVPESSGLVASRASPHVYWTHNDSGPYAPRVWAFRLSAQDIASGTARHLGYVEITGASTRDWEDIAAGPGGTIYVFDGGDNPPCDRSDKRIHRFVEPTIDPDGAPVSLTLSYQSTRFEYPDSGDPSQPADANDERYDAECLLVHPVTGDIYVVTKRTNADTAAARVYKLAAASILWNSGSIHVLQFVADISSVVPSMSTGGDVDATGDRVVIRNYTTAYEFVLPPGEPFEAVFVQTPRSISVFGEFQGEGICYAAGGGDLVTTSEVLSIGPQTFPVFITPWRLANVRAESVRMDSATIRWDTAEALGSNVNYGLTTTYGHTVDDLAPVTDHAVALTDLAPGQPYFYRVASGSLVYPEPAEASGVYFVTASHVAPDFDADGDVDQEDFGHLQACLSGTGEPQDDPACRDARLDDDSDVDLNDFAILQGCMSGAGHDAAPDCEP